MQIVGVQHVGAAPCPPDFVLGRCGGEAEPALFDLLAICDLFVGQVDHDQLMLVEPAAGHQHVAAVGQRDDIQRHVRERDLLARRSEGPAVGQQEAIGGAAGKARLCRFIPGRGK